jgi:beta-lactamase regulating signal transducer with metallopeptidase domain
MKLVLWILVVIVVAVAVYVGLTQFKESDTQRYEKRVEKAIREQVKPEWLGINEKVGKLKIDLIDEINLETIDATSNLSRGEYRIKGRYQTAVLDSKWHEFDEICSLEISQSRFDKKDISIRLVEEGGL